MNQGTLEKSIRLEKSLFNLIWLRMIKSNNHRPEAVVVDVCEAFKDEVFCRNFEGGGRILSENLPTHPLNHSFNYLKLIFICCSILIV